MPHTLELAALAAALGLVAGATVQIHAQTTMESGVYAVESPTWSKGARQQIRRVGGVSTNGL